MKLSALMLILAGVIGVVAHTPSVRAAEAFTPCDDAALAGLGGSLCTISRRSLQQDDQGGEQVELFVRKFPADPGARRGQVWLIAGGPGESGASLYPLLEVFRRAFPDRDLLIPDHRGTGYSSKLCPAQEAADSPGGIALTAEEWSPCIGALYADIPRAHAFTITNAAQDLSHLIRSHRGEGDVQVYAVSYGTQLVLRMMLAAPAPVDGIVLDGLTPPEAAPHWDLSHRTAVVDRVGRSLLDPEQTKAYAALLKTSALAPAWADVTGGDLRQFLGALLNFPDLRDRIPALLADLAEGDVTTLDRARIDLQTVRSELSRYPQSPPALPLVVLMNASENNSRRDLTAKTVEAEAGDALFVSPLPGLLVGPSAPLYERDSFHGRTPPVLPRTLVIHGTLDPNTPYDGAVAHAALLARAGEVTFATVEDGAHLLPFVAADCFVRIVSAFDARRDVPRSCASRADPAD